MHGDAERKSRQFEPPSRYQPHAWGEGSFVFVGLILTGQDVLLRFDGSMDGLGSRNPLPWPNSCGRVANTVVTDDRNCWQDPIRWERGRGGVHRALTRLIRELVARAAGMIWWLRLTSCTMVAVVTCAARAFAESHFQ